MRGYLLTFFVLLIVQISLVTPSCSAAQSEQTFAAPDAALWQAVAENNAEGVVAALKAGAYIDSKQIPEQVVEEHDWAHFPKVMTPFVAAIYLKNTELALFLLETEADVLSPFSQGVTPIQVSIAMADEQVFSALLGKGADIKSERTLPDDPDHLGLIGLAAGGGSLKIMSAILAAGHVMPPEQQKQVALLRAALWSTPQMFEFVVRETGVELSPVITAALIEQARHFHSETFLRFFYQREYLDVNLLQQVLLQALQEGMDGLAADILTDHPDLWLTEMSEAISHRIQNGDPRPMIDLFSRFGKESTLLPYVNDLFLYCGRKGDTERIWSLLEKFHFENDQKPELLGYALHGAVMDKSGNSDDLIEKILQQPLVDINLPDEQRANPLYYAIQKKDQDLVKKLLAKNLHNSRYERTMSVLHEVCRSGMNGFVSELSAAGFDLEAVEYGFTPLGCAVNTNNALMVEELLQAGANPNYINLQSFPNHPQKSNPFLKAATDGNTALVALFIEPRNPQAISQDLIEWALHLLVEGGQIEMAKQILPALKDINQPTWSSASSATTPPIIHAIGHHQHKMIQPLLKHGAQLVPEGYHEADIMCHVVGRVGVEMTRVLLDAGMSTGISCGEWPLLSIAVANGSPELIELLLAQGNDINEAVKTGDYEGWTPLLYAVSENKPELVAMLIENGATTDASGPSMIDWVHGDHPITTSALMKAAEIGNVDMIRMLIRAGADIDQADKVGYTALMVAARLGQVDAVKVLLLLGANTLLTNQYGDDAAKQAAFTGNPRALKLLGDRGGDAE
jgi:ankyrin repeat protein